MNDIFTIQVEEVSPQPWRNGGGQTRELFVWPTPPKDEQCTDAGNTQPGSLGGMAFCAGKGGAREAGEGHGAKRHAAQTPSANQEWQLRISRADIEASGPFSAFPGVQRWFVVLSGKGVVLHMPSGDHTLLPGDAPLHFDGGLAPGCTLIDGPTQDLNLMVRGGSACVLPVQSGIAWDAQFSQRGLYTACSGTWSDGHQTQSVAAHTLLWLPEATPNTTPMRFISDNASPSRAWWLGFTPEPAA